MDSGNMIKMDNDLMQEFETFRAKRPHLPAEFDTEMYFILKKLRKAKFANDGLPLAIVPELPKEVKIIDLMEMTGVKKIIQDSINERLKVAPEKTRILIQEIRRAAEYYRRNNPVQVPDKEFQLLLDAELDSYRLIANGENAPLRHFDKYFNYAAKNDKRILRAHLAWKIATGAAWAYILPELKLQLKELGGTYSGYPADNQHAGGDETPMAAITGKKLKWKGTPAQFGFIMLELIGKGYLEKPTGSNHKDAEIFMSLFDIDTTPGTLKKELSSTTNSLSADNGRQLTIGHIDKQK